MTKEKIGNCLVWRKFLCGYPFDFLKLSSGYITAQAPMGNTPEDKEMFDKLVYYNQRLYNGKDEKVITQNIIDFIKKHKKQ